MKSKFVSVADLLSSENIRPIDVVNVLADYVQTKSSIGNNFRDVFTKNLKFSEWHKTRIRNSLKQGIYDAAAMHYETRVLEFSSTIRTFATYY